MLVLESKVAHADIAAFAEDKVNLTREDVNRTPRKLPAPRIRRDSAPM